MPHIYHNEDTIALTEKGIKFFTCPIAPKGYKTRVKMNSVLMFLYTISHHEALLQELIDDCKGLIDVEELESILGFLNKEGYIDVIEASPSERKILKLGNRMREIPMREVDRVPEESEMQDHGTVVYEVHTEDLGESE